MLEPIDFDWMERALHNNDVRDCHRWNYLRHRLWIKKQRKDSKES